MKPPEVHELVGPEPRSLDEGSVLSLFLGKTRGEALKMFESRACTEEFTYMAPIGFLYYLQPALEYLKSESSKDDWDFAHGLLCSLSCRVAILGVDEAQLRAIRQVADFCDTNRSKWNLGSDDLLEDYLREIRKT